MPYIQAIKGRNRLANGKLGKEYYRHFVIIPRVLIDALGWKKGDELEFKLVNGQVLIKRKGT